MISLRKLSLLISSLAYRITILYYLEEPLKPDVVPYFYQIWKMIKSQLNVVADVDKAKEYPSKYICYC
jgi:hypothetical protein